MNLDSLQQQFARALINSDFSSADNWIAASELAAERRLWVYHNQVHINWLEALAANYPGVKALLGDACFRSLAARYARDHGSTSGDLRLYGEQFPVLLELAPEVGNYRYVADVGRLELALRCVGEAAESPVIGPAELARVPPESWPAMRLQFVSALDMLLSDYPVDHLLAGARGDTDAREKARDQLRQGIGAALIVRREQHSVVTERLETAQWIWIESLRQGKTFEEAHEMIHIALPEFSSFEYEQWLQWLFERNLVSGLSQPDRPL